MTWIVPAVAALVLLPIALGILPSVRRKERKDGKADCFTLIALALEIVAVLLFARQLGTWTVGTLPLWWALVAIGALGLAGLVVRAADLPWRRASTPRTYRIVQATLSCGFAAVLIVALALL